MENLRVAIITKKGNTLSLNGTRAEIDTYLLQVDEQEGLKAYRIVDKDLKQTIEHWEEQK
jgi:hypothetical protein